jgi:hypothetical protein
MLDLKFSSGLGLGRAGLGLGLGLVVCGLDYNTDTYYNIHQYMYFIWGMEPSDDITTIDFYAFYRIAGSGFEIEFQNLCGIQLNIA